MLSVLAIIVPLIVLVIMIWKKVNICSFSDRLYRFNGTDVRFKYL